MENSEGWTIFRRLEPNFRIKPIGAAKPSTGGSRSSSLLGAPCILKIGAERATIRHPGSPVDRAPLGRKGRSVVWLTGLQLFP